MSSEILRPLTSISMMNSTKDQNLQKIVLKPLTNSLTETSLLRMFIISSVLYLSELAKMLSTTFLTELKKALRQAVVNTREAPKKAIIRILRKELIEKKGGEINDGRQFSSTQRPLYLSLFEIGR